MSTTNDEAGRGRNLYRDSRQRMASDPVFRSVVMTLAAYAEQEGLTPGELKQIAFTAAMVVEERNARPMMVREFTR